MDQNTETPMTPTEPGIPAAEEVIDVQASQVGEPVSVPIDTAPFSETVYTSPPAKNNNGWIIAIIILVMVCCCCILFFIPMMLFWRVLGNVIGWAYQFVLDILNGIFGGTIRFY